MSTDERMRRDVMSNWDDPLPDAIHTQMAAHDGYAPHSHNIHADHQGAAWDPEPWMRSRRGPQPVPPSCRLCGHWAPHQPHPDGQGWPARKLWCAACPGGVCELPAPAPQPEDARSWYHRKDGTVCVSGHDSLSMLCCSGGGPVTAGPPVLPAPAPQQPDDYLTPEQHAAEAGRLLWVIDDELQGNTPRGLLDLATIALAHAVTALATRETSPALAAREFPAEGGSAAPAPDPPGSLRERVLAAMAGGSDGITTVDLALALLVPSPLIAAELEQMRRAGLVTTGGIRYGKWFLTLSAQHRTSSTSAAGESPPEGGPAGPAPDSLRDQIIFWLSGASHPRGWTLGWLADQTGYPRVEVAGELAAMAEQDLVRSSQRGRKTLWSLT